jgi:hypothetical protein
MNSYRVTFFKTLLNSEGHAFKCPQRIIHVRRAKSVQRALKAAQCRLERASKAAWTQHADDAEVQSLPRAK